MEEILITHSGFLWGSQIETHRSGWLNLKNSRFYYALVPSALYYLSNISIPLFWSSKFGCIISWYIPIHADELAGVYFLPRLIRRQGIHKMIFLPVLADFRVPGKLLSHSTVCWGCQWKLMGKKKGTQRLPSSQDVLGFCPIWFWSWLFPPILPPHCSSVPLLPPSKNKTTFPCYACCVMSSLTLCNKWNKMLGGEPTVNFLCKRNSVLIWKTNSWAVHCPVIPGVCPGITEYFLCFVLDWFGWQPWGC